MFGDNPSGAGNQQERPGIEQWVVGFVEASPLIKSQANGYLDFWNPQRPYASRLSST